MVREVAELIAIQQPILPATRPDQTKTRPGQTRPYLTLLSSFDPSSRTSHLSRPQTGKTWTYEPKASPGRVQPQQPLKSTAPTYSKIRTTHPAKFISLRSATQICPKLHVLCVGSLKRFSLSSFSPLEYNPECRPVLCGQTHGRAWLNRINQIPIFFILLFGFETISISPHR